MSVSNKKTIAIDWGSTSFRAYLLDESWQCVDKVENKNGIFNCQGSFSDILKAACAGWMLSHDIEQIIMGGMIGSRNGWVETAYSQCPVSAQAHRQQATVIATDLDLPVQVLQGVQGVSPCTYPDVMRGEEIQLFGVVEEIGSSKATVCLPGTHSKWVHLEEGSIQSFATLITGELFALVTEHSSIGTLIEKKEFDKASFLQGVQDLVDDNSDDKSDVSNLKAKTGLLHSLFSVRARAVSNTLQVSSVFSYLSGLIIADEISTACQLFKIDKEVILITDEKFKEPYQFALQVFGRSVRFIDSETAFLNGIKQLSQIK